MSLACAISGTTPEDPVFSKTGYVFERRLIEKHINATGKCPVTDQDLTKDDLQAIHTNKAVKPRPITAASIPGLLSLFQSEWDSVMSETFVLRTHLDTVRNQLSHSLYQHDAATRVIARLLRERDVTRKRLEELQKQLAIAKTQEGGEAEPGISDELMNEMQELAKKLLATRKKRRLEGLVAVEQVKTYTNTGQFPLHSATSLGVLCCDVDPKGGWRLLTGGIDGNVVLCDLKKQKTVSKLQGHMKRVNAVKAHPTEHVVLSCSDDKSIRVWKGDEESLQYKCCHVIRKHKAEVCDLSLHPLNNYFVSCAKDHSWAFFELDSGRCLRSCVEPNCDYRCLSFHPDGMILGGGREDGAIHIWDMKGAQFRASLTGHQAAIRSLSFSENGYYLATASDDGTARLWDLRKSLSFQTIPMEDNRPATAVRFDHSGQYIAIGSLKVDVYFFETRTAAIPAVTLSDNTAEVTDVAFGPSASYMVSTAMERIVRLYEPEGEAS